MSLYLTIFPLSGPEDLTKTSVFPKTQLEFDQDYEILGQLTDTLDGETTIKARPIPPQLWVDIYEEKGRRRIREDRYDEELTFVYAYQLKKLKMPEGASHYAKAVKAFIDALPDDVPIILWWL